MGRTYQISSDIIALRHVSRIFGHCNNPALPLCMVCGHGISSCSVLKYWLENEKHEVVGCCNVLKFYWHALEGGYLLLLPSITVWKRSGKGEGSLKSIISRPIFTCTGSTFARVTVTHPPPLSLSGRIPITSRPGHSLWVESLISGQPCNLMLWQLRTA